MNYDKYCQVRQLFESDRAISYGYDINEWLKLETPEKVKQLQSLNESLLLAGLISGLLGFGVLFRKKILSKGVKSIYMRQLVQNAKDFKRDAMKGLQKAIKPYVDTKNKIKRNAGAAEWIDLKKESRNQVFNIERKIEETLTKYVDKVRELKSQEVNKKIDSSKRLSDTHKLALKYTWETLSTEVVTSLLAKLIHQKLIESPQLKSKLEKNIKTRIETSETQSKKAWEKIEMAEDEPQPGDKYIVTSQKLNGEKEFDVVSIDDKTNEVKLKHTPDDPKEQPIYAKVSLDKLKTYEKVSSSKTYGEGELIDKEI